MLRKASFAILVFFFLFVFSSMILAQDSIGPSTGGKKAEEPKKEEVIKPQPPQPAKIQTPEPEKSNFQLWGMDLKGVIFACVVIMMIIGFIILVFRPRRE